MAKRGFDIVCSLLGLILLLPVFLVVSVLIKVDSPGPVFFRQERVGRNFKPFRIFKFRSMAAGAPSRGPAITVHGDKRVTAVGSVLRRYKIDELPQLMNVLRGDMSLVGPRPEVAKYVELFREDYATILQARPGITDPASLRYADEERLLSGEENWEESYISKVLPEKILLAKQYIERRTLFSDIRLIIQTVFRR